MRTALPAAVLLLLGLLLGACAVPEAGPTLFASQDEGPLIPDMAAVSELPDRPQASASSEFWEWWGDGRAELAGYRMTVNRYGEPREAELSLIYVTEPHDRRTWIKDDGVEELHRVNVLKLNQQLEFLTGIYPYSVMTSTFAPVDAYRDERFEPVRIVHSVQEWCGAYSHRLWPGREGFASLRLSYFAQEGERTAQVETGPKTLYEDALLIQLRELDGPFAHGGNWEGMLVPELWRLRTVHRNVAPVPATITREEGVRASAQGDVLVTRFTLAAAGYERVFEVERERPRRVLGWSTSTGEAAELLASERLAYWSLNALGDESYRERLGLSPLGSLPPGNAGVAGCGG